MILSRLSKNIVGASLLLIIYFTLFPFDFFFNEALTPAEIFRNFDLNISRTYALEDFPRNMVLFMPLGFGLAGLLSGRKGRKTGGYSLIVLGGVGLSLTVEVLQSYTLQRFPSFGDVVANGSGTAVGLLIFHFFGPQILETLTRVTALLSAFFTLKRALVVYLLYISLWLSVSYFIQDEVRLSNWDDQFPLLIGNEGTGDRPWNGVIKQIEICDRALTVEEVSRLFIGETTTGQCGNSAVAFYDFTGDDQNFSPMLDWQGDGSLQTADDGLLISKDQWLRSEQPVRQVSQALAASSQFTIEIWAASKEQTQSGPARILTISEDAFLRNITIGQEKTDLVFRLRTPLTGLNGRQPEFVIPAVFNNQTFHRIIITYDSHIIRFYIDDPADNFAVELAPSMAIFTKFFPDDVEQIQISRTTLLIFRLLYRGAMFLPLSFLALIWLRSHRK